MKNKVFTRSIKVLIVSVLFIMAFTRGNLCEWLLIGFGAAWLTFATIFLIRKMAKHDETTIVRKRPKPRKVSAKQIAEMELNRTLLMHINYRITLTCIFRSSVLTAVMTPMSPLKTSLS